MLGLSKEGEMQRWYLEITLRLLIGGMVTFILFGGGYFVHSLVKKKVTKVGLESACEGLCKGKRVVP